MMYQNGTGNFFKGMLTGVATGAVIYVASRSMKNTNVGKKLEKNVNKTMRDVGSVVDNFTTKFR